MNVSSLNPQKKYGQWQSLTEVNPFKPKDIALRSFHGLQIAIISVNTDMKLKRSPPEHFLGAKVLLSSPETRWHIDNSGHGHTLETQCHRGRHHRA
jgi:hypothetical protein